MQECEVYLLHACYDPNIQRCLSAEPHYTLSKVLRQTSFPVRLAKSLCVRDRSGRLRHRGSGRVGFPKSHRLP